MLSALTASLQATFVTDAIAQVENNSAPWEMFAKRLITRLQLNETPEGKLPGLQIVVSPTTAEWSNATYGKANLYLFANTLSSPGPIYSPDNDLTLFGQYKMFLESLDLPVADKSKQTALDEARKAWLKSTEGFTAIEKARNAAWRAYSKDQKTLPKDQQTPYAVWYQREYGAKIGAQEQVVSEKAFAYAKLLSDVYKGYSGLGSLITGLQNKANFMNVTYPNLLEASVPIFLPSTDIAEFIRKGDAEQGFVETWEFDKKSERRSFTWSQGGASAGFAKGWFGLSGNAGEKKEKLDIDKDGTYMKVTFKNFTTVSVAPGSWFDGNAIKALWEGPYKADAIGNKEKLFGSKGSFKQRPSRVVLAYKPKITVRLDASTYKKIVETWKAGGSVRVGAFSFGGSKSGGKDELTTDDAKNEFTIEDKTGIPVVLAVINVAYPQQ